jgi:hypothetical protein
MYWKQLLMDRKWLSMDGGSEVVVDVWEVVADGSEVVVDVWEVVAD